MKQKKIPHCPNSSNIQNQNCRKYKSIPLPQIHDDSLPEFGNFVITLISWLDIGTSIKSEARWVTVLWDQTSALSGMMRSCMFFSHVTTRYTLTYNQVNSISIYKKRRVPLVEQELPTIPEHLSSPRYSVGFVLLDL